MLSLFARKEFYLIAHYCDGCIESFGTYINEDSATKKAESIIMNMPESFSHFEIKTIIVARRREDNGKE